MPYPPKPQIQTSYTAVEQALGDGTLPGQEMDNDFANVVTALSALNDFVRGVTRSDGRLGNGTVTRDTLAADILLGVAPPEPWQTGQAYASPDTVFESNRFYVALTDHTSTDFASDLAAGRWLLLADFTLMSQITVGGATFTGAATQGEAETGTATDRLMTPLRTAQAISALRPLPLAVNQGGTGASSASDARTALGATTVGNAVFTAADAAAARTALGATAVGNAVLTAADAAAGRAALGASPLGVGQSWLAMTASRASETTYQNTSGRPIVVSVVTPATNVHTALLVGGTAGALVEVAAFSVGTTQRFSTCTAIVPDGHFYRYNGPIGQWAELR